VKPRLWALLGLALLPLVAVAGLGVQAAVDTRRAFGELNASLATLTEAARLDALVRQGLGDQLAAAREYLARHNEPARQRFTRLGWTTYEQEARYLELSLTPAERQAVEHAREQHRQFQDVLEEAMASASGQPQPGLEARFEAAQAASARALEDVSRLLQLRMGQVASRADESAVRLGRLVTALAALFLVSLLLVVGLLWRAADMQRRLVEAERLAAVAQVGVTLRHDPRAVAEWAEAVALAAARIRDVLRRLEQLRAVETVDYVPGVPMVELGPPSPPAPPDKLS